MMTAWEIIEYMESLQNAAQRLNLMRFFKTGPGEYGEGDELDSLAASPYLWKQRMSIVCSWYPSHHDDPSWCLRYAIERLPDAEDYSKMGR